MKRRTLLQAGVASFSLALLPFRVTAAEVKLALTQSNLVYLSPILSNGAYSRCQAEVWYVMLGPDVLVCTASNSWRARAPGAGFAQTKMWVGDLGVWTRADYQSLPTINAMASVETDPQVIASALQQFGYKYPDEWGSWGRRFRKGLADGSRIMLRYRLST